MVARRILLLFAIFALTLGAQASGPDETVLTPAALAELEHKADAAGNRDKCALYMELVHGLTELAGRQIDAGDASAAQTTMEWIDRLATKVHATAARDSKHLQNAEVLMEHTTHRLADMMRLVSSEQRTVMRTTLDHLNRVHTEILMQVFAK